MGRILAPCPFCDGKAALKHERIEYDLLYDFTMWWKIKCTVCGISLSERGTYMVHDDDGSIEDICDAVRILVARWNHGRL